MSEQETEDEGALSSVELSCYEDTTVFTEEIIENADRIVNGQFVEVFRVHTSKYGKIAVNFLYGEEDVASLLGIMKHAHHANIVPFLGVLLNDEKAPIGYVLEHMENGDVYTALNSNNLLIPDDIKQSWILQAARGLEFLHGKGLIHRGLNTQIMRLCNSYETLRLGGLGWCCHLGQCLDLEKIYCFTGPITAYNPPEVKSHQKYTSESDVYSLGSCIVEILRRTEKFQHEEDDFSELIFVTRLLSPDPESRPKVTEIVTFFEDKKRKPLKISEIPACDMRFAGRYKECAKKQREYEETSMVFTISQLFHESAYSLKPNKKSQQESEEKKTLSSTNLSSYDGTTVFFDEILENADLIVSGRFGGVFCVDTPKYGKVAVNVFHDMKDVQPYLDILKHAHHANIVPFLGVLLNDENAPIGYVLEHMEDDVHTVLHRGDFPIDVDLKCSWMHQAARGLEFLHGKGLVHGGVNPAIMRLSNSYKTLRLAGFGWRCHLEIIQLRNSLSLFHVGREFHAPEVNSDNNYSTKSDVYSLGTCMIAIFGGAPVDAIINVFPIFRDVFYRTQVIIPEHRSVTMAEIAAFFEEKELLLLKRKVKKIVFDWKESEPNIFTMDMLKDAEKVGSGMYGEVYRTKTDDFGDVAVKIFKNCITVQEQREIINMMKHSNHSNIVRFLGIVASDASSAETPIGYAMEYMPEKTVSDALHNTDSEIPAELRYSWICQACKALLYLHGRGILHRDVKPLNMLLCDSLQVLKMCDMGMSKNFIGGESLSVGIGVGTLEYVAPEVLSSSKKKDAYSCSADVYSMAICLWEILSRRKPYKDDLDEDTSVFTFLNGIINGTIRPSLEGIEDVESKMLLERAWNSDPVMRPEVKEIEKFSDNKRKTPLDLKNLSLL